MYKSKDMRNAIVFLLNFDYIQKHFRSSSEITIVSGNTSRLVTVAMEIIAIDTASNLKVV